MLNPELPVSYVCILIVVSTAEEEFSSKEKVNFSFLMFWIFELLLRFIYNHGEDKLVKVA